MIKKDNNVKYFLILSRPRQRHDQMMDGNGAKCDFGHF